MCDSMEPWVEIVFLKQRHNQGQSCTTPPQPPASPMSHGRVEFVGHFCNLRCEIKQRRKVFFEYDCIQLNVVVM